MSYRLFDRRVLYLHPKYVDRRRPKLIAMWGMINKSIYAMAYKTGSGPAVVCTGLLPDRHAFRGSYGGYSFPLYDRRSGNNACNLDVHLVQGLSERYQTTTTPEEVFDAIVALLSAASYTRRFAADLEDAFPHVPFPTDFGVFREATNVGARIRGLQTFELSPEDRFWTARLEGSSQDRTLAVPRIGSAFLDQGNGFGIIRLNPTLRLERVPVRVWEFAVSGYRIVHRWLEARNGVSLDEVMDEDTGETLQRHLLDLVARAAAYIDASDAAEPILEAALAAPLTKSDLKLGEPALL